MEGHICGRRSGMPIDHSGSALQSRGCRGLSCRRPAKSGGNHFGGGEKMKSELSGYVQSYLRDAEAICSKLSQPEIERIVEGLVQLRADGGRLFILGVGGSAANASHAVNDFRKIANIESYTPTDNVSELTARINDDGWGQATVPCLMGSRLPRCA